MAATTSGDSQTTTGDTAHVRLRLSAYDALAKAKGFPTVVSQATLHGLNRATLFDLRAGRTMPLLETAMRMAADLGVPVEAIWERMP